MIYMLKAIEMIENGESTRAVQYLKDVMDAEEERVFDAFPSAAIKDGLSALIIESINKKTPEPIQELVRFTMHHADTAMDLTALALAKEAKDAYSIINKFSEDLYEKKGPIFMINCIRLTARVEALENMHRRNESKINELIESLPIEILEKMAESSPGGETCQCANCVARRDAISRKKEESKDEPKDGEVLFDDTEGKIYPFEVMKGGKNGPKVPPSSGSN